MEDNKWTTGTWKENKNRTRITFHSSQGHEFTLNKAISESAFLLKKAEPEEKAFYPINDPETIQNLLLFKFFFRTRSMMEKNIRDKRMEGNDQDFGKAVVFKNFEFSSPISV
jgi:hypothetical protein